MSPDVKPAQVQIKRRWFWLGSLLPWTVWLDNEKVGKLRVGGTLAIHALGPHAITVSQPTLVGTNSKPFSFNQRKVNKLSSSPRQRSSREKPRSGANSGAG